RVVGENADVDLLERALAVPGGEVAQVGRVGALRRLGDPGGREVALARADNRHPCRFALALRSPAVADDRFQVLARLAVHGANIQRGQVVGVAAELGQEELARAVAAAAYERGALYVDVIYFDPWVKRERILHAAP